MSSKSLKAGMGNPKRLSNYLANHSLAHVLYFFHLISWYFNPALLAWSCTSAYKSIECLLWKLLFCLQSPHSLMPPFGVTDKSKVLWLPFMQILKQMHRNIPYFFKFSQKLTPCSIIQSFAKVIKFDNQHIILLSFGFLVAFDRLTIVPWNSW